VLIVDDDVEFVTFMREFLVDWGYEVDRAAHGADALVASRLVRPDLVLLDLKMRGLSGLEVLKRLRTMDATIPVIMVTADDDPLLIRETREIGAYGYLVKPVDFDHLKRMIHEALAPARQSDPGVEA